MLNAHKIGKDAETIAINGIWIRTGVRKKRAHNSYGGGHLKSTVRAHLNLLTNTVSVKRRIT